MKNNLKIIMLTATTLFTQFSFAQNLVPNPSFEDTIACPTNYGQIDRAVGWSSYRYSPDYLNSCSQSGAGVPSNLFGYQIAKIGDAYIGLTTYGMNGVDTVREYIGAQLIQPLIIGTKYFISCFISRGDEYYSNGASNNFGFCFSMIPYNFLTKPFPIENRSQVNCDSIIRDSINWVRIAGSFIADSAYQYIVIGNFYDNAHTDTSEINNYFAYYFMDAVCLTTDSLYSVNWIGISEPFIETNPTSAYPNPVKDKIFLRNMQGAVNYCLFNSNGQMINLGVINKIENGIDLSSCSNGLYMLAIENKYFYKILINHY